MIQPYATHRLHRSQGCWTCILIVTSHVQHVHDLRSILVGRSRMHIEWARDAHLAFDLSAQVRPQLVLIDALLKGDRVTLLRRELARGPQSVTVVSCHERGRPVLGTRDADAVHWDELPLLLRHWVPPIAAQGRPCTAGAAA